MIPNLGWKFYYKYFLNLSVHENEAVFAGRENVQHKKRALTEEVDFEDYREAIDAALPPLGKHTFKLVVAYPGLLIGSGYHHEVGVKEEFKLGFFFDHCTGLPLIPGSSVKGALRSVFERGPDYIALLLAEQLNTDPPEASKIKELEIEIFGPEPGQTLERDLKKQDLFYDAVPISSYHGKLLGADTITPHINREHPAMSPFSDPTPLPFLKILPGVCFRFDFDFKNSSIIENLTGEEKKNLLKKILLVMGLGAKSNVGYGKLTPPGNYEKRLGLKPQRMRRKPEKEEIPSAYILTESPQANDQLTLYGKIQGPTKKDLERGRTTKRISFFKTPEVELQNKRHKLFDAFEVGEWVSVRVQMNQNGNQVAKFLADPEKIEKPS